MRGTYCVCLVLIQCQHSWGLLAAYVTTFHNLTNDLLTRATKEVIDGFNQDLGLKRIDARPAFCEAMELGAAQRALSWQALGGDWVQAFRLRELRLQRPVPTPLQVHGLATGLVALEWRAGIGSYLKAWANMGGVVVGTHAPALGQWGVDWIKGSGAEYRAEKGKADVVFTTLTEDKAGGEMVRLSEVVRTAGPAVVVADYPQGAEAKQGTRNLERQGYSVSFADCMCTELGDVTARRRHLVIGVAERAGGAEACFHLTGRWDLASGVSSKLLPASHVTTGWVSGEDYDLVEDPRIVTTANPRLPVAAAHLVSKGTAPKERRTWLVYSVKGPVPTVRRGQPEPVGEEVCLLRQPPVKELGVRGLTGAEVERIQAYTREDRGVAENLGIPPEIVRQMVIRATPPRTVEAIAQATALLLATTEGTKAGVCRHVEEAEMDRRLKAWLKAWCAAPEDPASQLATQDRKKLPAAPLVPNYNPALDQDVDKVGAPRRVRRAQILEDSLVPRLHPHGPDSYLRDPENRDSFNRLQQFSVREEKELMMTTHLAPGTLKTYESHWTKWQVFCAMRGQPSLLLTETRAGVREAEEQVLDLIAHLNVTLSRTPGTIKTYLFAVRSKHERQGFENPMRKMNRVHLALKGLKRTAGATQRKFPVTARMLSWIEKQLDLHRSDDAVVWGAFARHGSIC